MRNTFITSLLAISCSGVFAQAPVSAPATTPAACADIEVTGLQADTGTLNLAAYNSGDSFFKKPSWADRIKVVGTSMRVSVCGVASGEIAVTGFQDLNGNNKMDSNPLGIPAEPYGASGKPPQFSAPTWDTTKVAWPPQANAAVKIRF